MTRSIDQYSGAIQPDYRFPLVAKSADPIILTPDVVQQLYATGWNGVGLALHIVDSAGNMLLGYHKRTDHNRTPGWGPITETVRTSKEKVEKLRLAAARCIEEELGRDANGLGLRKTEETLTVSRWPRLSGDIFALTMPLLIPEEAKESLLAAPPDTAEIAEVCFAPPEVALRTLTLREGTHAWIRHLGEVGLDGAPRTDGPIVEFPAVTQDDAYHDTDRSRLKLVPPLSLGSDLSALRVQAV